MGTAWVVLAALAACPLGGEEGPSADLSAAGRGLSARLHAERVAAREALIAAGARALPVLREALRSSDRVARREAARALGRIGGDAAQAALEELLHTEAAAARKGPWLDPTLAYVGALAMCETGDAGMSRVASIAAGQVPALVPIRHQAYRAAVDVLQPEIVDEFRRAHGGGSYPGRFAAMRRFGVPGVQKLAEIANAYDQSGAEELQSHARLGIQALGDIDLPQVLPVLEALVGRMRDQNPRDPLLDEVAHALFRRGAPALLNELIRDAEAQVRPAMGMFGGSLVVSRLAHLYLHAGRTDDAVRLYRRLAMTRPEEWGLAYYNTACAYSRGGRLPEALAALRTAIEVTDGRTHYDDADWMRKDGDLIAARTLPGFDYLVACCIVRDRIHGAWHKADPGAVREAIEMLRSAHAKAYRIEHQDDRETLMLGGLRHHPEFERLWTAMGGTADDDGR